MMTVTRMTHTITVTFATTELETQAWSLSSSVAALTQAARAQSESALTLQCRVT
jgi:hypothetical protein